MATPKQHYTLSGTITNKEKQALKGLLVRATDQDPITPEDLLGKPVYTNDKGQYHITYSEEDFHKGGRESKGPDIIIRVFSPEGRLLGRSKRHDNSPQNATIDLQVDYAPKPVVEQTYWLSGAIELENGQAARSFFVQAFDKGLRKEQLLGEAMVDKVGNYTISYSNKDIIRTDRGSADLFIKVFGPKQQLVGQSEILFKAPAKAKLNYQVKANDAPPVSTFELIGTALSPLLDDLQLTDLEESKKHQDITLLSGETGYTKAQIRAFVQAHHFELLSVIEAPFWFTVLSLDFYPKTQFDHLEQERQTIIKHLNRLNQKAVQKALDIAIKTQKIAAVAQETTQKWWRLFEAYLANTTIDTEADFTTKALKDVGIKSKQKQAAFAKLFNKYQRFSPELVKELNQEEAFEPKEIQALQTTYELSGFTNGNFELVKAIKDNFEVKEVKDIRLLAKKSPTEWTALAKKATEYQQFQLPKDAKIPFEQQEELAEVNGRNLHQQFIKAFPTTAFSGALDRAIVDKKAMGFSQPNKLKTIIDESPDFELLTTPIDAFAQKNTYLKEDKGLTLELKAVQRVFKLSPSFEATNTLMKDKLHSAHSIYRMGASEFVKKYQDQAGFDKTTALITWKKAEATHAATVSIVADLQAGQHAGQIAALKSGSEAIANFPNWNNLFKGGDVCECKHCRSVYSPAAYFADLLMFLKDRKPNGISVKDTLFERRPDLGYLELNCENANVTLPYIDVVNEVLEAVVADGENDEELVGITNINATDLEAAKASIKTAIEAANLPIGTQLHLARVGTSNRWVLHSDSISYLLKKKATPNYFVEVLRNTKATAAELRANPQYVNPAAYHKLKGAKYPFNLPFDLFGQESRAAFDKVKIKHWDLMQTFKGNGAPNQASDQDIAAAYFGLSIDTTIPRDEKTIILEADWVNQFEYWGYNNIPELLESLKNVQTFLSATKLTYNELLILLDLEFTNPGQQLQIQHLNASCDTNKKEIQGLDVPALDRINRFLRLWRKLKWELWELDLVIEQAAIGNGLLNAPFLVNLMYLVELKHKLGKKVSLEQVCSLFGDLNTRTRFTELHEKRAPALYQDLFLNKKLIHPLDLAFEVAAVDANTNIEKIAGHKSVIQAALRLREADLDSYLNLTKASNGNLYINNGTEGDLILSHLSFLYRHHLLAKSLKIKASDWALFLKINGADLETFATPKAACELVDDLKLLQASEFSMDELDYLLGANLEAKSAPTTATASSFLTSLRTSLQAIQAEFDPNQFEFLQESPPNNVEALSDLLIRLLQQLNRDDQSINYILNILENTANTSLSVEGLPGNFEFPDSISDNISISYSSATQVMRFTGMMTNTERNTLLNDAALAAVTGIASYQAAIEQLYQQPRLALKFFEPIFFASLTTLPLSIDFKAQLSAELAAKIYFNSVEQQLEFQGILSAQEKATLETLSNDVAYLNAINSLYTQPTIGIFEPSALWLVPADLDFVAEGFYASHLAIANTKLLIFLKEKNSQTTIIQQLSEVFDLSEASVRRLVHQYKIIGVATIFEYLKDTLGSSIGVIDYVNFKDSVDTYYWLHRVAVLIAKWGLTFEQLDWLINNYMPTQTFDFESLPVDANQSASSLVSVLRTERLLVLNAKYTADQSSVLEVLEQLHLGNYGTVNDFAQAVELLTEWEASEVEAWVAAVDLSYPNDYLLAEQWERLENGFKILDQLNAKVNTAIQYAKGSLDQANAQQLKQLLRSKYGAETWLTISTEIQDVLREQKRDALAAYLLASPQPTNAPSGKWETTNDLYAYYLLDVEMSACMLTSRLVQGSGSIQLFVQRCFMGLEPEVVVKADGDDGDSAWHWWKWMRKYRVWEANRKVFLYPENWIEPELRPDKSSFFKDLETELLQHEVNQLNVEQAYLNYLDQLNEVAQLEVAAVYHEDNADLTIMHVFGRTANAHPHIYYYRQYDYRSWTSWEKIEVDIVGDHLIPMVINQRLFIYWAEFREEPDEETNSTIAIPSQGDNNAPIPKTYKRTQLRLAGSEYRNKKWMPKKISNDFFESYAYTGKFDTSTIKFYPINKSDIDGTVGIKFSGSMSGAFELFGCAGVPIKSFIAGNFTHWLSPDQSSLNNLNYVEDKNRQDAPENDLSLYPNNTTYQNQLLIPLLTKTPQLFQTYFPWNLSYMDKLLSGLRVIFLDSYDNKNNLSVGAWLPFSYTDKSKTYFAFPMLEAIKPGHVGSTNQDDNLSFSGLFNGASTAYYPDIKAAFKDFITNTEGQIRATYGNMDLSGLTLVQKNVLANFLADRLGGEAPNPISDEELLELFIQFFLEIVKGYAGSFSLLLFNKRKYHFKNFYHPFICSFIKMVYNPNQGIDTLMSRATQLKNSGFSFRKRYVPTNNVYDYNVGAHYPKEEVDFSPDGSYASYNWELFYHAPLMIANSLSQNQRFEEAMNWYHYIFNPIGVETEGTNGNPAPAPQKYWITKPFFLTTNKVYQQQRIDTILKMLAGDTTVEGYSDDLKAQLEAQVKDWRNRPFEPHRIAQYRNVAYQKTVFMKYLDNLVAWGDHLFRQDSMESINEAVQLYILAAELLGPRPQVIPPTAPPPIETFNELEDDFDSFSNALIQVENYIPAMANDMPADQAIAPIPTLYFCIPQNDKILSYWDTIADRLYKIRNCMNIDGVVRQLSLFEPEIDPGALVKAVAGGMSVGGALADLNAPLPYYRFNVLLQRANEVCNDVKVLGNALLTALEKKDGEELSLLRQNNEAQLLTAIQAVREQQVEEIKANLASLKESIELTKLKIDYYGSKEFMNAGEIAATVLNSASIVSHTAGTIADVLAGVMFLVPDFNIGASGFGGSPHFAAKTGGDSIGSSAERGANGLYNVATILDKSANMASTLAGYQRRKDDWDFQKDLAEQELVQLETQVKTIEIQIKIAEQEVENQKLQIEQSKEVADFMTSKYTNKDLYQWMKGQVSQVYFKSYQLAYDLAKRAERCYRFELGIQESNFIQFGYWDSLKKGLLSGDKLQYDLRRLNTAYMEQNRRELELTKHISLAAIDPLALVKLRETGKCFFSLIEELFDLDYPGHYFRRIKSVSISLPCIAGPYTTVACSLRLLNNHIRIQTGIADGYEHNNEDGVWSNDSRFVQNNIPIKAIATSSAQNDSGVFELNFRDERYLPFEGAGVISDWTIDLFNDPNRADFGRSLRQFDYSTISDAIIHVRYTAREAGGLLREHAISNLDNYYGKDDQNSKSQLINLKHDFSAEWHQFMNPEVAEDGNVLSFKITQRLFPFSDQLHSIKINSLHLLARCSEAGDYDVQFSLPLPEEDSAMVLTSSATYGGLHYDTKNTAVNDLMLDFSEEIIWTLKVESPTGENLAAQELKDFYLILGYEWDD